MIFCHGSIFASLIVNIQGGQTQPGKIVRIEVTDTYDIISTTVIASIPPPMSSPLGLACDPRDDDVTFKLYFTHSALYAQGGQKPNSPYDYLAAVRQLLLLLKGVVTECTPCGW